MSLITRIQASSVTHPFSMNKKLDQFLSEKLPDLMDEFKVADRSDIIELDGRFEGYDKKMDTLDSWKKEFDPKLEDSEKRISRLRTKYGIKGGE
jgi:hypothetical protein